MEKRQIAYLSLGSNVGDRAFNLAQAVRRIRQIPGTKVRAVSPVYETSPVDVTGGLFYNTVAIIETDRDPHILMEDLHRIESRMGRTRNDHGTAARNIDIDLLLYGGYYIEEADLSLPHPRMIKRRFVMEPLADLAPDLWIPHAGCTASQMAFTLKESCPEQIVAKVGNLV